MLILVYNSVISFEKKSCKQIAFQNQEQFCTFLFFFPCFQQFFHFLQIDVHVVNAIKVYFVTILHQKLGWGSCQSWIWFLFSLLQQHFQLPIMANFPEHVFSVDRADNNHHIFTKFLVIQNPIGLSLELYLFIWKIKIIE